MMEAVESDVVVPQLMGSEVILGTRVCSNDGEARESDVISTCSRPKVDDFNQQVSHRGTSSISESSSWIQKAYAEACKRNSLLSRLATEDASQGVDHGISGSSIASISASDCRQTERKMGKVPRNGSGSSGSIKKLRMLQTENPLPQPEAGDTKMDPDKAGMPLLKCSNADKSVTVKQKSNINGRRGDRRSCKVQMKGRYDSFSLKAGLPSCSPTSGGSNTFGMYGLKPDIHDVSKLVDDISLDELLDGRYKHSTQGRDKGKKTTIANEDILDSVRKACSVLRLHGLQQGKQAEEVDVSAKKISLLSSPSSTRAAHITDGDKNGLPACISKCGEDQEFCVKAEAPSDANDSPLYRPKDILERLSLPPSKDLDSLLQDAMKPAASGKLSESRSGKPLSHCVTLPPFSWSNNFNGHYKSNNDATRTSNKASCQGRWVRIRSTATFIGGGNEGYMDLKSLTYDGSLVPAGKAKYRLPETGKTLHNLVGHDCCRQDLSSVACSTANLLPHASHSPTVLTAAQTLCDLANHSKKHNLNGIMKWPKQPLQKAMKARKSRSIEKTNEEFLTPTSESILDHAVRGFDCGSSSKKPKISVFETREVSHVQTVIGLSSVSAPRSSRSSPIRLSKEAVAETRHYNRVFTKPPFMVPPPPRVVDRSNSNPQKLRKVGPADWNRTRS